MNKLQGFYELKWLGIPSIPWKVFTGAENLDARLLWTIRVAVEQGNDINLPRAVGVNAEVAYKKGMEFLSIYGERGLVIYYPYFIAIKSGIIEVKQDLTIIEAVNKDLWNLTTKGIRDVTILIDRATHRTSFYGEQNFLEPLEIKELFRNSARIRVKYKDYIFDRSSIMVEWSYAINTDINKKPIGNKYLVFYECRKVK